MKTKTTALFAIILAQATLPLHESNLDHDCRTLAEVQRLQRLAFEAKVQPARIAEVI